MDFQKVKNIIIEYAKTMRGVETAYWYSDQAHYDAEISDQMCNSCDDNWGWWKFNLDEAFQCWSDDDIPDDVRTLFKLGAKYVIQMMSGEDTSYYNANDPGAPMQAEHASLWAAHDMQVYQVLTYAEAKAWYERGKCPLCIIVLLEKIDILA